MTAPGVFRFSEASLGISPEERTEQNRTEPDVFSLLKKCNELLMGLEKKGARLLHVGKFYPPHPGGMERHLKDLCEGLVSRIRLNVLVSNSNYTTAFQRVNRVPVLRVGRIKEILSNSICPALPFWARYFRPDIVHLHLPNPMAHLAYLFCRKGSRLVITWHSDIIRQRSLLRYYHPFLIKLLSTADKIIATSANYVKSSPYLKDFSGITETIPLGIDVSLFEKSRDVVSRVSRIRRMYGAGPFILFVGRLSAYKGLRQLVRAMKNVRGKLLIVGEGPERCPAEALVKKLELSDRVFFCGAVPDELLPAYYHACTVFVLPSTERSEAFGLVQLEAMACRKPVVSTNLRSGVPYVNQHGRTGLVVEPGKSGPLEKAINTLLDNGELQKKYGTLGFERVTREFTIDDMVNRTFDIYREFL